LLKDVYGSVYRDCLDSFDALDEDDELNELNVAVAIQVNGLEKLQHMVLGSEDHLFVPFHQALHSQVELNFELLSLDCALLLQPVHLFLEVHLLFRPQLILQFLSAEFCQSYQGDVELVILLIERVREPNLMRLLEFVGFDVEIKVFLVKVVLIFINPNELSKQIHSRILIIVFVEGANYRSEPLLGKVCKAILLN